MQDHKLVFRIDTLDSSIFIICILLGQSILTVLKGNDRVGILEFWICGRRLRSVDKLADRADRAASNMASRSSSVYLLSKKQISIKFNRTKRLKRRHPELPSIYLFIDIYLPKKAIRAQLSQSMSSSLHDDLGWGDRECNLIERNTQVAQNLMSKGKITHSLLVRGYPTVLFE